MASKMASKIQKSLIWACNCGRIILFFTIFYVMCFTWWIKKVLGVWDVYIYICIRFKMASKMASKMVKIDNIWWLWPSDIVYSYVHGLVWKLRMSPIRIHWVPIWHSWEFCVIQDGVQNGFQNTMISYLSL